jgi:SAM-dependent methyltransferase
VDTVLMDSYLEITADQGAALGEAARVLEPGGRLVVSTPNRWSVGPDPHIGVPGGGLLPGSMVNAIAKQRMARPPLRHLLTAAGLRRALHHAGFATPIVELARVSDAQLATLGALGQRMGRTFNQWREIPGLRTALRLIGPILHASARRA